MKKNVLFVLLVFFTTSLFAQKPDTSAWDVGGITSFALSQTQYKYWSAGGDNAMAYNGLFNVHANYKKGSLSWTNSLDLGYGMQKMKGFPFRKTDDKIDFASKFGYKAANHWYYSALINFKSQFAKGYEYLDSGDSNKVSNFMAPGYLIYSVGMDYLPGKALSVYMSPVTGKTTFVMDKALSDIGAFGVDTGKSIRYEFGAYVKAEFNKSFFDSFTLNAKLGLFTNYLKDPQNIDVNFDLLAAYKLTKFLSLTFSTQLIYDHDVLILVDPKTGVQGRRLQIKEMFGIGLSYNF